MNTHNTPVSKTAIKENLLRLLNKKDLLDITVRELCHVSGVNRSTFYRHYDNIIDPLEAICDDILNRIIETSSSSYKEPQNALKNVTDSLYFFKEHDEYDSLFRSGSFALEILSRKMEQLIERNSDLKSSPYGTYLAKYLLSGSYKIILDWVNGGRKESVEELSAILMRLTSATVKAF